MVGRPAETMVVKLGGSVVTFKDKPYTVNAGALGRLSRLVSKLYASGARVALVHGGGSFGHTAVSEVSARRGVLDSVDVAFIQYKMLELALAVSKALIEEGVPATVHPGHSTCRRSGKCVFNQIYMDLENGLVPMTYGDAVYDDRGYTIISGDDLAFWMASALHAGRIIFVTSVPGVLDVEGRVIRRVTSIEQVVDLGTRGYDVTGGMRRKVEAALEYSSQHDAEIRVVDLDGFETLLEGGEAGTVIGAR